MQWAKDEFRLGWRALLTLGRVSQLPTVWSNCLAGWLLSGGASGGRFLALCLGASSIYLGGAFLDNAWNNQARPPLARPLALPTVWLLGLAWFALGALFLASLGHAAASLSLLLLAGVILYNLLHRVVTFSPVLSAFCRFLLYLIAGAATGQGVSGLTIWSGLALAAYVLGCDTLAQKPTGRSLTSAWPCLLLAVPLLLGWLVNDDGYRRSALFFIAACAGWIFWCLRYTFGSVHRNLPLTVRGLTAGIVLVDLLAVNGGAVFGWVFVAWFIAAVLFQRVLPNA